MTNRNSREATEMTDKLIDELNALRPELIAIRHDLHRHPEVGFEETRTSALVLDRLRQWGLDVTQGIGKTGVVATLKGKRPGQRAIGSAGRYGRPAYP
jgi:metal-dependent amidase/aminoacylase/carboxypeptidase family protein